MKGFQSIPQAIMPVACTLLTNVLIFRWLIAKIKPENTRKGTILKVVLGFLLFQPVLAQIIRLVQLRKPQPVA